MGKINIRLQQHSETAMQLEHDTFKIIIDRPVEKGGGGQGLMGGQYMLTGIAGCFCSNLLAAAQARDIEIKGLTIDVSATIADDPPKRFSQVDLNASYDFCSDESMFNKLLTIAEKACISANTVKTGLTLNVIEAASSQVGV